MIRDILTDAVEPFKKRQDLFVLMAKNYIELNAFLKVHGLAPTGGQAKNLIRSGEVLVNGEVENRNKRKLRVGDVVMFQGKEFVVEEELLR